MCGRHWIGGVARLDDGFGGYPALKSQLRAKLSAIYLELGDVPKGVALARQSVEELSGLEGADPHQRVAAGYALAYALEVSGADRADVLDRYRSLLRDARAIHDDAFAELVLNRLAAMAVEDGRGDEAAASYRALRALLLKRLGLESVVDALRQVQPIAEARSEEARRRARDFEWLAVNAHNLCRIAMQDSRLDEAERECDLSRALKLTLYPPLHPAHIATEVVLAHIAEKRGDLDATIAAERRILAMTAQTYGEDHYRTAYMQVNLASSLGKAKDFEGARALFDKALATLDDKLGRAHEDALEAHLIFAEMLLARGDVTGLKKVVDSIVERTSGKEQLLGFRGAANFVWARSLWRLGRRDEARDVAEKARSQLVDHPVSVTNADEVTRWLRHPDAFDAEQTHVAAKQ